MKILSASPHPALRASLKSRPEFTYRRYLWLGLPILLFGALIMPQFDGLYGQDAYAYHAYATGPLRVHLAGGGGFPWPPFFWPPGFPFLVALASFIIGPVPQAGQVVSLLAGALVPVFTAWLAYEVWAWRYEDEQVWLVPLAAGLLVAFCGQLWQSSVVVMSDTTGLAAATAGMWALARYGRLVVATTVEQQSPGSSSGQLLLWLIAAAAAMAYAVFSRWAYPLVAIPCTIYALWVMSHLPRRTAVVHVVAAALTVLLIQLPIIVSVWRQDLAPTVDRTAFIGNLQGYGWHPLNLFRHQFDTTDGFLNYRLPNLLYYVGAPAHRYFLTPLFALFLGPGLWHLWHKRSLAGWLLLVGWAGMVAAFHAGAPRQNFRFTLVYLPPVAILAAIGIGTVWAWLPTRRRWWLTLLVGLGLAGMAIGGWNLTQDFVARKNANLELVNWVTEQTSADAELYTFGVTLAFQQYSPRKTYELFFLSELEMAQYNDGPDPNYLLLDMDNVSSQWRSHPPWENYLWLQDIYGLTEVGQKGPYTLFEVGEIIRD